MRNRTEPLGIAIADKSPLIVAGLRQLFDDDVRFSVVAAASDGERFLDVLARFPVEVGVIGWQMPFKGGREVLEALRGRGAPPRIVVYSGADDTSVPQQVLALGGAAFVSKREPVERLVEAIDAVAEGRMVFPFVDVRRLADDPLAALSRRELELLEALGTGRTNAELARTLQVSVNTIKFHLRNLFDKIDVRNRAQAVRLWHEQRR